ncbi:TPA_asm: hypothetical protein [Papaver pavoninum amalgavirus 1]|nr:TPA_asm: hypothetical protein [Papaver pavoninum amalgavirus 1]
MGENRAALETLFDPAKEAKDLDEGLATLWAAGCDKARFTRLMIHAAGRTVPAFLKEIKGLLAITDQALLARIWGEAITANLCSTPILADVLGICKFAKWLKGKDGVAVVNNLQLERKIEKKKPATASVADSSLASLLDIQVQDYAQKRRAAQSEGDREIDRIKKKLEIAKKNLRVRLSEIDDRFSPASIYEAPTATELGSKCWNRYIDDCAKEGKDHVEFSVISQKEITDRYSTIITAEHKLQFCSERANKEAILEYTKKRILELDAGEGVRQADKARQLLALASGGTVRVDPRIEEAADYESDSSGGSPIRPSARKEPAAEPSPDVTEPATKRSKGLQGEGTSTSGTKDHSEPDPPPRNKHKGKLDKAAKRALKEQHTHSKK